MGNVRWAKTWFLITRIDEALRSNEDATVERQLWFDLGKLFGTSFRTVEPQAASKERVITRDLEQLEKNIRSCASQSTWERRLDEAICQMCDQLLAVMENSKLPILTTL
jgi:hypothetical protein